MPRPQKPWSGELVKMRMNVYGRPRLTRPVDRNCLTSGALAGAGTGGMAFEPKWLGSPSTLEMPEIILGHVADPAGNLNGVRGVGEGGTLGPYAAITNAVCDALSPMGVRIDELPLSPARVRAAVVAAGAGSL